MHLTRLNLLLVFSLVLLASCEKDPISKPPIDNNHQCDTSFDVFGF